jgi:hypothetical protein
LAGAAPSPGHGRSRLLAAALAYLLWGPHLALLLSAGRLGVPLGPSLDGRGTLRLRGRHDSFRAQYKRMPADDAALERWYRAQPGVEGLAVRRVRVDDPEMRRLLGAIRPTHRQTLIGTGVALTE